MATVATLLPPRLMLDASRTRLYDPYGATHSTCGTTVQRFRTRVTGTSDRCVWCLRKERYSSDTLRTHRGTISVDWVGRVPLYVLRSALRRPPRDCQWSRNHHNDLRAGDSSESRPIYRWRTRTAHAGCQGYCRDETRVPADASDLWLLDIDHATLYI